MKPLTIDEVKSAYMIAESLKKSMELLEFKKISNKILIQNLNEAAHFLERTFFHRTSKNNEEEIFPDEKSGLPENVQDWISDTFTTQTRKYSRNRTRLRSLVNLVKAGIYFDRIYRRLSVSCDNFIPASVLDYIGETLHSWEFDMFHFNTLCRNHSLKAIGYELLHHTNILSRFNIELIILENFLMKMEEGYSLHNNPYHNLVHAADVAQTCFVLISKSKLISWMSDIEILAILIAAIIHDYEHTGTTNNYHIVTSSNLALIYNDRSVLENFHVSSAFIVLQQQKFNFINHLSKDEYKQFRSMIIEMVLATDMSIHFKQMQTMKEAIMVPENLQKVNILSFVLHAADISHPCKSWKLHQEWTNQVVEEFFQQGDKERDAGLSCSPLCDRHTTMIPQSQIGERSKVFV